MPANRRSPGHSFGQSFADRFDVHSAAALDAGVGVGMLLSGVLAAIVWLLVPIRFEAQSR